MISKIHLKNFKSHEDTSLELSNINLLTGMNGLGKSSIIQALLLLRQSQAKGLLEKGLDLNGDLCSIGSVSDCLYQYATSDNIDIEISSSKITKSWSFKSELTNLSDTFIPFEKGKTPQKVEQNDVIFSGDFQYISAFRNGPVNNYDKDTSSVELLNQISRKEGRCELVAHFFHYFKDYVVVDDLKRSSSDSSLATQVEAWMREISPNINVHVQPNDTSFKINYSYNSGTGKFKTNEFKASNIGFGVSYALPIVVATLQACSTKPKSEEKNSKDHFIIIENPEAHIHPSGQSKLMELICLAARNGVQFLIETHSDHIINGLLVATKKGVIEPKNSSVYYFDREEDSHATKSYLLPVLSGGKIKDAPKGFFDQLDVDMSTLMGF